MEEVKESKSEKQPAYKDVYNWYLGMVGVLSTLPILAPIFMALNWTGPAKIIYLVYSFFCHQFASRSLNVYDFQYAWCARDTGIWLGMFVTAILVRKNWIKSIRWYWVLPFIIPMALDGGIQTIFTTLNLNAAGALVGMPLYVSNNLSRFMTGAIFGIGVGLWIAGQLKEMPLQNETSEVKTKIEIKNSKYKIVGLILSFFILYVSLVALWNITSTTTKPIGSLDFVAKQDTENFFARRENGACPTTSNVDLLNLECFFK